MRDGGEAGSSLLEFSIVLALAALLLVVTLDSVSHRTARLHSAVLAFEALMARAGAAAAQRAVEAAGAPSTGGLTLTVRPSGFGSRVEAYVGRPGPGAALPLLRAQDFPPLPLDAVVTPAGTASRQPFSLFLGSSGSLSVAPGYDASSAAAPLASEPACSSVDIDFTDGTRSEHLRFACSDGHELRR